MNTALHVGDELARFLERLENVSPSGNGYKACCPAHDDKKASLSISQGKDGRILLRCFAGCDTKDIVAALGLTMADLFPNAVRAKKPRRNRPRVVATYDYVDEQGNLLFQVLRKSDKNFPQRRPDGKGGWIYNLDGVRRVLYRLPKLLQNPDETVLLVEGEKDVHTGESLGFLATCNPGGAGKWDPSFTETLRGRNVVIIADNDEPGLKHARARARDLYGAAASVKLIERLPGVPPHGDLTDWVNAGGTREQLLQLIESTPLWEPPEGEEQEAENKKPDKTPADELPAFERLYITTPAGMARIKATPDGPVAVPIANFSARIVSEEVRDDGAEQRVFFRIVGETAGRPLPEITVPADQFASMNWVVARWGSAAVVMAGQGQKDHVRAAIQLLSGDVERRTVFLHTGWRKLEGGWAYLHTGGAIGAEGTVPGVVVELEGDRLKDYLLPDPPAGEALKQAVAASLSFLEVAPERVTFPLLAAVYRAPLGEMLACDFSLFLAGRTGAQKSSLAAVAQGHYGAAWNLDHLPGSWASSGNALERLAFLTKDALFVCDDFAPTGDAANISRLHRDADRLLRAAGNRAGRDRMRPDTTLRPSYAPRGLILSTGEDIPHGESVRARTLILELSRGEVDLDQLTILQQAAADGLLAQAMAGYIRWLAPQVDELKRELPGRLFVLRRRVRDTANLGHDRTPAILASLALGLEVFVRFAQEIGVLGTDESEATLERGWASLLQSGEEQAAHHQAEEPTGRFLALIQAAINSGRAHLADIQDGGPPPGATLYGWRRDPSANLRPLGTLIGWTDGTRVYLEPNAAFAEAQAFGREQGTALPLTQATLWKRLAEQGLIVTVDEGGKRRLQPKRTVAGRRQRVVELAAPLFQDDATEDSSDTAPPGAPQKVGRDEEVGRARSQLPSAIPGDAPLAPLSGGYKGLGFSEVGNGATAASTLANMESSYLQGGASGASGADAIQKPLSGVESRPTWPFSRPTCPTGGGFSENSDATGGVDDDEEPY